MVAFGVAVVDILWSQSEAWWSCCQHRPAGGACGTARRRVRVAYLKSRPPSLLLLMWGWGWRDGQMVVMMKEQYMTCDIKCKCIVTLVNY